MIIDAAGWRLMRYLFHSGWAVGIKNYIARECTCLRAFNKEGPLNAYTQLDTVLFTVDNNPRDIAIRFLFIADPERTGTDKSFTMRVQKNNFQALRSFCERTLHESDMDAPYRYKIDTGGPGCINPVHKVQLVYWKQQ